MGFAIPALCTCGSAAAGSWACAGWAGWKSRLVGAGADKTVSVAGAGAAWLWPVAVSEAAQAKPVANTNAALATTPVTGNLRIFITPLECRRHERGARVRR